MNSGFAETKWTVHCNRFCAGSCKGHSPKNLFVMWVSLWFQLDELMEKRKTGLDAVVEFAIDDSLLVRRITGRYMYTEHVAWLHEQLMNIKCWNCLICFFLCSMGSLSKRVNEMQRCEGMKVSVMNGSSCAIHRFRNKYRNLGQVSSHSGLWDCYWGRQNKRLEAIVSPMTIPQTTVRWNSLQISFHIQGGKWTNRSSWSCGVVHHG